MSPDPRNLQLLIDAGAKTDALAKEGWTPLDVAAESETPKKLQVLIDAGADGSLTDRNGKTPFDLAVGNQNVTGTDVYWALNDARYK